jgi:hypothetical protein
MKQSFQLAGVRLEALRKSARSALGCLDGDVLVKTVQPEKVPPRQSYARRIDHAIKFANGTPSVSGQFRELRKTWDMKLDALANECSDIESQMGLLVRCIGFIRGDAGATLPDGLSLELTSAARTLHAGAKKGLPVSHVTEIIAGTARDLDSEVGLTKALIQRCREAGHVALAKQQSVLFERSALSFGLDSRRGSSYLDLSLKSATEFRKASADFAAKYFSGTDNSSKKTKAGIRSGQISVTELFK